jgi:hypothetical protein
LLLSNCNLRRYVAFRHRRLEKLALRVTLVRLGRHSVVLNGDGHVHDDDNEDPSDSPSKRKQAGSRHNRGTFSNPLYSRALRKYALEEQVRAGSRPGSPAPPPPGAGALTAGAARGRGDGTKEHTSVLHALSGTMAGALAKVGGCTSLIQSS